MRTPNFTGIKQAPTTNVAYESPQEVIDRKRQQKGIGQLGTYQPNGPSLNQGQATLNQPKLGNAQVQPSPNHPSNVSATQTTNPNQANPQVGPTQVQPSANPVVPTTNGTLSGQLATSGGLPNASAQPGRLNDPTHYRTPHIPGTWQNLGNSFNTRESANAAWQPQLGSLGWWQLGGANQEVPTTYAPLMAEDPSQTVRRQIPTSDTRLASHVAASERNSGYHAQQGSSGAVSPPEFRGNLTYDPNLGKPPATSQAPVSEPTPASNVAGAIGAVQQASNGQQSQALTNGISTQTQGVEAANTNTPPYNPEGFWPENASEVGPEVNRAAATAYYTANRDPTLAFIRSFGHSAEEAQAIYDSLVNNGYYLKADGKIANISGQDIDSIRGRLGTPIGDWPDEELKLNVQSGSSKAKTASGAQSPEDLAKAEEDAAWQDVLKFLAESRGTGQISQDAINEELRTGQEQRALEQGRGTWAALELAANTNTSPEATQGLVADISQRGAIEGSRQDSQVRMQREYFNAQKESEWAAQMAQVLTIMAGKETDKVRQAEMFAQAKEMADLQAKLGIKMMYIQDQLNTPSAGEVIGGIFGNAAQAVFGGLGGGLARGLIGGA